MLAACSISDALITWNPADEELLCGNAAVYAVVVVDVIIIIVIVIIIIIIIIIIITLGLTNDLIDGSQPRAKPHLRKAKPNHV